jgi:hypothetical protein
VHTALTSHTKNTLALYFTYLIFLSLPHWWQIFHHLQREKERREKFNIEAKIKNENIGA